MNSVSSQSRQGGRRYRSYGSTPSLGATGPSSRGAVTQTQAIPDDGWILGARPQGWMIGARPQGWILVNR